MKSGSAILLLCGLGVAALLVGARVCSHESRREAPRGPAPAAAQGRARQAAATGSGSIAGRVVYRGPPLPAERRGVLATAGCAGGAPREPEIAGGGVASAFVFVSGGLGAGEYPVPDEPVALDQKGCEFSPRVFGIRAGQTLEMINGDPTLHNVHALGAGGGFLSRGANAFNVAMPVQNGRARRRFDAPQTMVTVVCDVHPWMRAYAGVVAHPFFAVSSEGGSYRISGLPAGKYLVEAWQERLGRTSAEVVVSEGGSAALDLAYAR